MKPASLLPASWRRTATWGVLDAPRNVLRKEGRTRPGTKGALAERLENRLLLAMVTVSHPESVIVGEWASIAIRATNETPSTANATLFVSFPPMTEITDSANVRDGKSTDSDCAYSEYAVGSRLADRLGKTVTTTYVQARWQDSSLVSGETDRAYCEFRPRSVGTFTFLVRARWTVGSNSYYEPETSGTLDELRWPVAVHTINVVPNSPPNVPTVPTPADDATFVTSSQLSWTCADPDGDSVYYTVSFDRDNPDPTTVIKSDALGNTADAGALARGGHYYWRVKADDHRGGVTLGPVWDFSVEPLPDPEILPIRYNASLETNQWGTLEIKVKNNGGASTGAAVEVSFLDIADPANTGRIEEAMPSPPGWSFGVFYLPKVDWPRPQRERLVARWTGPDFAASETRAFSLRYRPLAAGDFNFSVHADLDYVPIQGMPDFPVRLGQVKVHDDPGEWWGGETHLNAIDIGVPMLVGGRIGRTGDVDLYQFQVKATSRVEIALNPLWPGTEVFAPTLRLFDGEHHPLKTVRWSKAGPVPPIVLNLEESRDYFIGVSGYDNWQYVPPSVPISRWPANTGAYTGPYALGILSTGEAITVSADIDDPRGSPDELGPYLIDPGGVAIGNIPSVVISAHAMPAPQAVGFDTNFNGRFDSGDCLDDTPANGWTWTLNTATLTGDQTLKLWPLSRNATTGTWNPGADSTFYIRTVRLPAWFDRNHTTIGWNRTAGEYVIDGVLYGLEAKGGSLGESAPSWLRGYTGAYFGTALGTRFKIAPAVNGGPHVYGTSVAPVMGFSVFGYGQCYRFPYERVAGFHGTIASFVNIFRDPLGGYFGSDFTMVDLSWLRFLPSPDLNEGENKNVVFDEGYSCVLGDDLRFQSLNSQFTLGIQGLIMIAVELPPFVVDLFGVADLIITPYLSFSPILELTSGLTRLASGDPKYEFSVSAGVWGVAGASFEIGTGGGLVSGGIDVAGSVDIRFKYTRVHTPETITTTYSIPLVLGIDINFVGQVGWGLFSGTFHVFPTSGRPRFATWGFDLYSHTDVEQTPQEPSSPGSMPVEMRMANASKPEQQAMAFTRVSLTARAEPLIVSHRVDGKWISDEIVASSNHYRGDPAIISTGSSRWMTVWSESVLDAGAVPGRGLDQIAGSQEICYALRDASGWTQPLRLTSNTVCDDLPTLAQLSDGRVMAVWRQLRNANASRMDASDLVYAVWNGMSWSGVNVMADSPAALSSATVVALAAGQALALWQSDGTKPDGSIAYAGGTVWASIWNGMAWSPAQRVDSGSPGLKTWPTATVMTDGSLLALWKEQADAGSVLMASRRKPGELSWSAPEAIISPQPVIESPALMSGPTGAYVVYHGFSGKEELVGIHDEAGGRWSDPRVLSGVQGGGLWPTGQTLQNGTMLVRYVRATAFQELLMAPTPDLAVGISSLADTVLQPGSRTLVRALVSNIGWAASSGATVRLYDGDPAAGGVLIGTQPLAPVSTGEMIDLEFEWTPAGGGTHQLFSVLVPGGADADAGNNIAACSAAVIAAPTVALDVGSDTGELGDFSTGDRTPTLVGDAPAGARVQAFVDSQASPAAEIITSGPAYSLTLPALLNGWHSIWLRASTDLGISPFSEPLVLLIDCAAGPTLVGDSTSDSWYVRRSGTDVNLWNNATGSGSPAQTFPYGGFDDFTVFGTAGDTLILDLSAGAVLPSTGLTLDGGQVKLQLAGAATLSVDALSLAPGASLDLGRNTLVVKNGHYGELFNMIRSARSGSPHWTGSGVGTSVVEANKGLVIAQVGSDVRISFGFNGDAANNGVIDSDDYGCIDRGFHDRPAFPTYEQGNFNYDRAVDADDYFLIDSSFMAQERLRGAAKALAAAPAPARAVAPPAAACRKAVATPFSTRKLVASAIESTRRTQVGAMDGLPIAFSASAGRRSVATSGWTLATASARVFTTASFSLQDSFMRVFDASTLAVQRPTSSEVSGSRARRRLQR